MNTTETKHTPTPWRVEYGTGIYGADNLHICTTPEANQMPKREGRDLFWETRANADFIVRACNEHAALRETISALLSVLPYGNEALQIKAEKLLRGEL